VDGGRLYVAFFSSARAERGLWQRRAGADGILRCGRDRVTFQAGERRVVARHDRLAVVVEVAFLLFVKFDEGAEEQAIDVSDDRGAARGDAAFGEEIMERSEVVADALDGLEVLGLTDERLKQGEIILGLTLDASVMEAEGACAIGSGLTATA
jgi:hypothetical protein